MSNKPIQVVPLKGLKSRHSLRSPELKPFKSNLYKHSKATLFVIGFGLLGTILFFSTFAATPTASVESESGTRAEGAILGTDQSASGGQFTAFSSVLTPTSADLIVTDLTWAPATPSTGNDVIFTAIIKNQGATRTPDGVIQGVGFYINGTQVSWNADRTTGIEPGDSVTLTATGGFNGIFAWTPATSGAFTARAYVDDAARMTEANENNNILEKIVTVGQSPTPPTPPNPPSPPPPSGPPRSGLTLIRTDDFNNSYDTNFWFPRTDGPNPPSYFDGYQHWTSEDVYTDGQSLVLRIQKRNYCGESCVNYTAGKVVSYSAGTFGGPGYYEARMKLPRGNGFWNGWWMYALDTNAEIDIVEDVNSASGCVAGGVGYCLGIHWWPGGQRNSKNIPVTVDDAQWHTYGLDWTTTYLKFYVDGVLQYTETNATIMNEMNRSQQWDMRFRTVVGSTYPTWPGPPDPNAPYPSYMYIDYFKAWR